jgi:hypothetical protein
MEVSDEKYTPLSRQHPRDASRGRSIPSGEDWMYLVLIGPIMAYAARRILSTEPGKWGCPAGERPNRSRFRTWD